MSGQLAQVEARIETVHKLSAVIGAMRGIAASRLQEAHRHLRSIRTYTATIADGIGEALAFLPESEAPPGSADGAGGRAVVVFCAEQGFAGGFSQPPLEAAAGLLRDGTADELLIVGSRGPSVADELGLSPGWSTPMISHPGQLGALAGRITEAIYERLALGRISEVTVIHPQPGPPGEAGLSIEPLVPFDFSRFAAIHSAVAPRITLPVQQLLTRLVEEYVFAELSEAVMLSFAAENEARMRAMIAAHDNVMERLHSLTASSRRLRQDEITSEIIELATGAQPRRYDTGAERRRL